MAQTFEMVKDINNGQYGSNPRHLYVYNGKLYFKAYDSDGLNPWVSDGTTEGTQKLININSIGSGSFQSTVNFFGFNDKVYFKDVTAEYGTELWMTDGTTEGTELMMDISPGTEGSNPSELTEMNGQFFFRAGDGTHGSELWVSDGTATGTTMVKDINLGPDSAIPYDLTEFNGKLYFRADNGVHGKELWVSDGTSSGTYMLKDIYQGAEGSDPAEFTVANGELFFAADDGIHGEELWKTDGTLEGTVLVKDIDDDHIPNGLPRDSEPRNFVEYNGKLYFSANLADEGRELYVSDGTTQGTYLFFDFYSGIRNSGSPSFFHEFNGNLYFRATDGSHGSELWVTNGTVEGTSLVKDLYPGPQSGGPMELMDYNNDLYFIGYTTDDNSINLNSQLWTSDGTESGTTPIFPEDATYTSNSVERMYNKIVEFNGSIYFRAKYNGYGFELWKYTSNNLGIEDASKRKVTAYPNPVNDILYFNTTTETIQKVDLFTVTGQRLKTWEDQSDIDISEFAPGIYFVKITTNTHHTEIKQVIKN
ncbi:hypothetical protein GCM10008085_04890 [Winogradskyella epiphytica]|nr:hypothetical protein GCM10008085_04890 [Winogradskyella epiphytica]